MSIISASLGSRHCHPWDDRTHLGYALSTVLSAVVPTHPAQQFSIVFHAYTRLSKIQTSEIFSRLLVSWWPDQLSPYIRTAPYRLAIRNTYPRM